ncbi:MAG: mechanosensitive ion channel family protein [Gemmatimonadales bacterium]
MDPIFLLPSRVQVSAFVLTAIPRVIAAVAVLLAFWVALRLSRPALRGVLHRAHFAPPLIHLLVDGLYKGTFLLLGAVMAASQLGVNIAAALAGLGVVGIAVGFAAQETIANMIAGFLIFWDRPFKVGDFVTTEGRYGEVREITMRTTRIRTMENTYVVIPNKEIIGETLVNHSLYGEVRVNVPIGIAYRERVADARRVLLPVAQEIPGVLRSPPPEVVVHGLASSSVDLEVRVWIDDPSLERRTGFLVLEACKAALDEAGIQIPFPHLQLIVDQISDQVWTGASRLRPMPGGAG